MVGLKQWWKEFQVERAWRVVIKGAFLLERHAFPVHYAMLTDRYRLIDKRYADRDHARLDLLREVADSGIEWEAKGRYKCVQIDEVTWSEIVDLVGRRTGARHVSTGNDHTYHQEPGGPDR